MRVRVLLALAALAAALPLSAIASAEGRVLPPGQEPLIAEMLGKGAALPGACVWAGATVESSRITSQYDCGPAKARVAIELRDRALAGDGAIVTRELSIERASAAAPGLREAIADRARAREGALKWIDLAPPTAEAIPKGPAPRLVRALVPPGAAPLAAWIVVIVLLAILSSPIVNAVPRDRAALRRLFAPGGLLGGLDLHAFAIVTALALALRLAVPFGPMDFAEPERLAALWSAHPTVKPTFESLPALMQILRGLGLGIAFIYRVTGPILGALGAGFAYLLARESGLRRHAAMIAAIAVLVWPAHARYSASGSFTVAGATIWTCAFLVAVTPRLAPAIRIPLLAALVVLGVHTRPEYRLLVVAMAPLLFTRGWTWRGRLAFALLLAVSLAPYAIDHGAPGPASPDLHRWLAFFAWTLRDASMGPPWWIALGLAGLVLGRAPWQVRLSLSLATALLLIGYARSGSEDNPLWGEWRYAISVVPYLAIAASALIDRLPRSLATDRRMDVVAGAALLSGLAQARALGRPIDLQVEHAFVRESAARIAAARPDLILLVAPGDAPSAVNVEAAPLLGIALALGPTGEPSPSRVSEPPPGSPRVWTPAPLLAPGEGGPTIAGSALFLGLNRSDRLLAPLLARFDLEPIEERVIAAAPMVPAVSTQCAAPSSVLAGGALADCAVRLGWYRLVPRARPR